MSVYKLAFPSSCTLDVQHKLQQRRYTDDGCHLSHLLTMSRSLSFFLGLLCLFLSSVLAVPYGYNATVLSSGESSWTPHSLVPRQGNAEKPFYLRIMCLGASITAGVGTSSGNGYRKPLRDQLRWEGWPVNMVGSQSSGDATFKNKAHEGHPGFVVSEVRNAAAPLSITRKPNLILINAGTNDADPGRNQDVATTHDRMDNLIGYLRTEVPDVTIILSTLLPSKVEPQNSNVNIINQGYRNLVQSRAGNGHKVLLAELNDGFITTGDISDNIHPNEEGFRKMAAVWSLAILDAEGKGWLTEPADTGRSDEDSDYTCDKKPGGRGPIQTQVGSGSDDGNYRHASQEMGIQFTYNGLASEPLTQNFFLAQLRNIGGAPKGGETDELVRVLDAEDAELNNLPQYSYYLNNGGVWNRAPTTFDPGLNCKARGVRFGDINGDGYDDFICIGPDGNMYGSINRGKFSFAPTSLCFG